MENQFLNAMGLFIKERFPIANIDISKRINLSIRLYSAHASCAGVLYVEIAGIRFALTDNLLLWDYFNGAYYRHHRIDIANPEFNPKEIIDIIEKQIKCF